MKKLLYPSISVFCAFLLSAAVHADNVSHTVSELRPTDILVSFLYFIGALLLIYAVLALVSRWGKKHSDKDNGGGDKATAEIEAESNVTDKQSKNTEQIAPEQQSATTELTENSERKTGKLTYKKRKTRNIMSNRVLLAMSGEWTAHARRLF